MLHIKLQEIGYADSLMEVDVCHPMEDESAVHMLINTMMTMFAITIVPTERKSNYIITVTAEYLDDPVFAALRKYYAALAVYIVSDSSDESLGFCITANHEFD